MISKMVACEVRSLSKPGALRQMSWLVGASVTLMGLSVGLAEVFGRTSFSQALAYAAFPLALMFSGECTYFRRYSATAKWVLIGTGCALILAIMWGAVALAERI